MTTPVFPISVILTGRRCLVVGNTSEAAQRAERLTEAGATVRLVSEDPSDAVHALAHQTGIELECRPFRSSDFDDCWLAVLADRNEALAQEMSTAAEATQTLFCAVDQPRFNSFAHLAIAKTGMLVVGVSTCGAVPAFARRLRDELQRLFDESNLAEFLDVAAEVRRRLPRSLRYELLTSWIGGVKFAGEQRLPAPPKPIDEHQ